MQHARSVYASGPVEIMPGLFIGDEHNARDDEMLSDLNITTILNVAKETVLPFQQEAGTAPMPMRPSFSTSVATPSAEQFFTPPTTAYPSYLSPTPMFPTSSASPSQQNGHTHLLRNTLSTPNLQSSFHTPSASPNAPSPLALITPRERQSEGDTSSEEGATDSTGSHTTSTSSSIPPSPPSMSASPAGLMGSSVSLPPNALALQVPASPLSGRLNSIRYIKLPWTHDETELAGANGGFSHGCAIIAEALGVTSLAAAGKGKQQQQDQPERPKGNILVHCQCGVSRSATLVIAFVMQAAALRYDFEETQGLMGMHDCYNMVKE